MGKIMNAVKEKMQSWLEIKSKSPQAIVVNRTEDLQIYFAKNKMWYIGDSSELQEFYKQLQGQSTSFWASSSTDGLEIKKMHSGLPRRIIDVLTNIVIDNYNGIDGKETSKIKEWEQIAKENNFDKILWKIVCETLYVGDGALRFSYDNNISKLPIIEWFSGEKVDFVYKRGRLSEIIFKSYHEHNHKTYLLKEYYGWGYVRYELFDDSNVIPLNTIDELANLKDLTFDKGTMWAVPFFIAENSKYPGRGTSKFDGKYDSFDSLDEILSQWIEAARLGRTKFYIPTALLPRDEDTGEILPGNPFDNQFIQIESDMREGSQNKIQMQQPQIPSESYLQTYMTYLDLCLQGLISPSTLGIDTKKIQDANASYERQMEKTTLYTRQGIIEALTEFIPKVVNGVLKSQESMNGKKPSEDIEINVNFGEYDSPSFDNQIDTISKAKNNGIMSIETSVKELYGDSKEENWINEEITRLKEEQGIVSVEEPAIAEDADLKNNEDMLDDEE